MPPRLSPRRLLPLALALPLAGAGCSVSFDPGVSESWQLDRLRILAVRAVPAEPRPGETTAFESLLYVPDGLTLQGTVWFACLPESADDFGCELDSDIDLSSADPVDIDFEELLAAGFIGFDPLFPPTWTPPLDALGDLSEAEAEEGLSAVVNITALPEEVEDEGDLELAYKRVPVSLAATPNHNPEIDGVLVDGALVTDEVVLTTVGAVHTLEPILSEGSIEDYTYTTSSGAVEDRVEEPYVSWYTESGTFDQTFALHPTLDVEWTAPGEPTESLLLVVARDRRGGMAWARLTVRVEAE